MRSTLARLRQLFRQDPPGIDFVGYEVLVDFIRERRLHHLDGDIIEIGVFMGGGTAKLARFVGRHGRRVYAIDIFEPGTDETAADDGTRMCDIYNAFLGEARSQMDVYRRTIRGLGNIVTIRADSREVSFPAEIRFFFGFIDGNHRPDYVRSDFHLVWRHLVPGGAVGFHDYDSGLPDVTKCIDALVAEHAAEIVETHQMPDRHILLLVKGQAADQPCAEEGEPRGVSPARVRRRRIVGRPHAG